MEGKLDIGQVIRRVFGLFGSRFGSFLGLGLTIYVAMIALGFAFVFILTLLVFGGGSLSGVLLMMLLFAVALIVAWATYHATVIRIAHVAELERTERLGESISTAFRRAGALILAELLIGICIAGLPLLVAAMLSPSPGAAFALLLFLFPGLYFAARFAVTIPTVVIEKKGAIEAMERSWKLTASNALRIFALMLLFGIGVTVASYVIQTVLGTTGGGRFIYALVNLVLLWPPMALLTAVIYFELREPQELPSVPTFGLPAAGSPAAAVPAAGAFQSTAEPMPPIEVNWDTTGSKPPPPPGS